MAKDIFEPMQRVYPRSIATGEEGVHHGTIIALKFVLEEQVVLLAHNRLSYGCLHLVVVYGHLGHIEVCGQRVIVRKEVVEGIVHKTVFRNIADVVGHITEQDFPQRTGYLIPYLDNFFPFIPLALYHVLHIIYLLIVCQNCLSHLLVFL